MAHRRRLYSDKDVGALIQRATEIQEASKESPDRGLTIQEVEHIATEIGIDPAHLRSALMDLESRVESGKPVRFWGGPFELGRRQVVEGALSEEQWEQIVQGLRRLTRSEGRVGQIGRTREWTRTIKDMDFVIERTRVGLRANEDQTSIEVQKNFRGAAIFAYAFGVIVTGTATGILLDGSGLSDLLSFLIFSGGSVSGIAAGRAFIGYWTKRQREKVQHLMTWLRHTLSSPESDALEDRSPLDFHPAGILYARENLAEPQESEVAARSRIKG